MTKSMGINIAGFVVLAFLLWKFSSDTKAYQQQVAESLTEQIAVVSGQVSSVQKHVEGLDQQVGHLAKQLGGLEGKADSLGSKLAHMDGGLGRLNTKIGEVRNRSKKQTKELADMDRQLGRLNTKIGEIRNRSKKLTTKTDALAVQLSKSTKHLNRRLGLLEYRTGVIRKSVNTIKKRLN